MSTEAEHGDPFRWGESWRQYPAGSFENWQSESLNIAWQAFAVAALAPFWFARPGRTPRP